MAGVLTVAGRRNLLSLLTGQSLVLRLFTNDFTPPETATRANFTEASFQGYLPRVLTPRGWSLEKLTATYPVQPFTSVSTQEPQLVFGYFITRDDGTTLVAERFASGPYVVQDPDDAVAVSPVIAW